MALSRQTGETAQVRIPADLNAGLDGFFSDLKLRILDRAVRRASSRANGDGTSMLQSEDVLAVAPTALADAVSELGQAFLLDESQHVRRAS